MGKLHRTIRTAQQHGKNYIGDICSCSYDYNTDESHICRSCVTRKAARRASRVQVRDMKAILQEYVKNRAEHSGVFEVENGSLSVTFGGPNEEGYSYTNIEVFREGGDGIREYRVIEYVNSRDCDGPHTSVTETVVVPRSGKAPRWYWANRWDVARGEKRGKFHTKSAFVVKERNGRQRDHFAESMGY